MRAKDLRLLPRLSDGLSFLYAERVRVEQEASAIVLVDDAHRTPVPVASLSVLMLGPGSSVTHAAMVACGDNGCSVVFCGEHGVRFYASGHGETRRSSALMAQARAWADPQAHLGVVKRMYRMRFSTEIGENLTLEQIRGMEGVRVREAYAAMARETGIAWSGRSYRGQGEWSAATPVNRALSAAHACLYGLCHAAIVSLGYSPGLGFVHTGKSLAFVYDLADLYKVEITVPLAFRCAKGPLEDLESDVRRACRNVFHKTKLLARMASDLPRVLGLTPEEAHVLDTSDDEPAPALWGPKKEVAGAYNYGEPRE